MKFLYSEILAVTFGMIMLASCNTDVSINHITPEFNVDTAYFFIEKQISYGPRLIGSAGHEKCKNFLYGKLIEYADTVKIQKGKIANYRNDTIFVENIIARFDTSNKKRIMLFAHYDTRPKAEQDTNFPDSAFLSANDGASGVALLLEVARNISLQYPETGVDIIFFDAEDQGEPLNYHTHKIKYWCLGAKYWSDNTDFKYKPKLGIAFDMVATKNACFTLEDNSRFFAANNLKRFWKIAELSGFSKYFCNKPTGPVVHDHLIISQFADIRSFIIMPYDSTTKHRFPPYWHTLNDNLQNIDKQTLKAVGQSTLNFIYSF